MKRLSLYGLLTLLLFSCSGEENVPDEPEVLPPAPTPENVAPGVPQLLAPQENLVCTYSTLTFEWKTSADPEGKSVSYELEISRDSDFSSLAEQHSGSGTSANLELEKGSIYYWRVRAKDAEGLKSSYSEKRSFSTEPELSYNSVPLSPASESPEDGTGLSQEKVGLSWKSSDSDGDALTYDLYFGTTNPPALHKAGLDAASFEVSLEKGSTYYWKVVASDGKGARALGPVWSFKTL